MTPDVGTAVKLLLFERVHGGHITGFANVYRDDGQGIWLPVALILDGWRTDLHLLRYGEPVPDRMHRVELTDKGLAHYTALRAELGPEWSCDWIPGVGAAGSRREGP